jgi:hypothetical protein
MRHAISKCERAVGLVFVLAVIALAWAVTPAVAAGGCGTVCYGEFCQYQRMEEFIPIPTENEGTGTDLAGQVDCQGVPSGWVYCAEFQCDSKVSSTGTAYLSQGQRVFVFEKIRRFDNEKLSAMAQKNKDFDPIKAAKQLGLTLRTETAAEFETQAKAKVEYAKAHSAAPLSGL